MDAGATQLTRKSLQFPEQGMGRTYMLLLQHDEPAPDQFRLPETP